jgi:uncharacterized protein YqhQ
VNAFRSTEQNENATCHQQEHAFGGQAVIEGVMMRGRHSWGLAVRRASGDIARVGYPLAPAGSRHPALRFPVIRGVVGLAESLSLGIRALRLSANIAIESQAEAERAGVEIIPTSDHEHSESASSAAAAEPDAFSWKHMTVTVVVALALAVGLFIVLPLFVVKLFEETFANPFLFNLVEGLIRIAIFILYLVGVSFIPDLRRTFEYHGAEHKVIHAYEACGRPDAELAQKFSTRHPRCGTGFLLLVLVIAVFVFAVVGKPSLPWLVFSRLVGIPLIIGIAYEIGIKWAGRRATSLIPRVIMWPGIQLQRLTTREPTPDQLEVAVAALEEVMVLDQAEIVAQKEALALT